LSPHETTPLDSLSKLRTDVEVRDAYKLGRTLGRGGFAVVRLATDRATGKEWAVKVMLLPRQGQQPGDNDNTM
jgi:calcium/calmodulin-dependent protein kinase I